MILNEDYFDDLEIKDEDIMADDTPLDVEEPKHELTVKEYYKLLEQYNHLIRFRIEDDDMDTTFIQTSLIPRIFKRLDTIFESYGIEDYKYVLVSSCYVEDCNTVVKFGDYQLFCKERDKDKYINDRYDWVYINVFVNYPEFTYKRVLRFLYTVLNLYRFYKQINWMTFEPITTDDYIIQLEFGTEFNRIEFYYDNIKRDVRGNDINLCKELTEEDKRVFYNSVFRHFFGEKVDIDYDAIIRDVPFKPIRPLFRCRTI